MIISVCELDVVTDDLAADKSPKIKINIIPSETLCHPSSMSISSSSIPTPYLSYCIGNELITKA